jgi:hypothetical protein
VQYSLGAQPEREPAKSASSARIAAFSDSNSTVAIQSFRYSLLLNAQYHSGFPPISLAIMHVFSYFLTTAALLALSAFTQSPSGTSETTTPAPSDALQTASTSTDPEFEKLKSLTPLDACQMLSAQKLLAVFPELKFVQHQHVAPRMSGYVWDSRCVYWAGVGSVEYAKDTPTHTVDLFVNTAVSSTKAQANLASRHDLAKTATGYQAQPNLGVAAYTIVQSGAASLYVVKDQSELQINVSDLSSSNDAKRQKLVEIFRTL